MTTLYEFVDESLYRTKSSQEIIDDAVAKKVSDTSSTSSVASSSSVSSSGATSTTAESITSGEIQGDLSILDGFLESKGFISDSTGWRISADGNVEFASGYFRGDITGASGTFSGTITGGSLNIPDTTTANSFHVETDGDTFWGTTPVLFIADNTNANAYILKTGAARFSNITVTGGTIGGQAVANIGYIGTSTADAVPTGLTCSSTSAIVASDGSVSSSVVLTWTAISTNTFDHYQIRYKKATDTYYAYIDSKTNTITISGLVPNISYNFGLSSINKYGTSSSFSSDISQTTATSTTAPATVMAGSATAGIQYVIVEWTHNTDTDLASYNIYRNTSNDSGTAILIGNCRTNYFVDGGRTGGQIYYYWIKAVNTSGLISANFSTVKSATPRNVTSDDIVTIAGAKVLIDGTTYLSNWRHSSDFTKIDGGDIYANSITTTQLNFTPVQSTDVIASINASAEGITIDADNITISGSSTFAAGYDPTDKVTTFAQDAIPTSVAIGDIWYDTNDGNKMYRAEIAGADQIVAGEWVAVPDANKLNILGGSYDTAGSGARVRIFPDANTGILVTDGTNDVFKCLVGGTNVGDVVIGDYTNNKGIMWDNSAATFNVKGSLATGSGSVISADYLTAGTITSKAITLAVSAGTGDSKIQAGKTDFTNTDSGFILGIDDSDSNKVKFYIGDSTQYLNWTGTAFKLEGVTLTASTFQSSASGERIVFNDNGFAVYNADNTQTSYLNSDGCLRQTNFFGADTTTSITDHLTNETSYLGTLDIKKKRWINDGSQYADFGAIIHLATEHPAVTGNLTKTGTGTITMLIPDQATNLGNTDDWDFVGINKGTTHKDYKIEIDGTGNPNTFKWSDNGGVGWVATTVAITGADQTLTSADGSVIYIKFSATTGGVSGDYWTGISGAYTDFKEHFKKMIRMASAADDGNGMVMWVSDGTSPNGALSGNVGDICFYGDSGKMYHCTGTTNWTSLW